MKVRILNQRTNVWILKIRNEGTDPKIKKMKVRIQNKRNEGTDPKIKQ